MLHLVCECQPLQTQHFFIFLFASLKKWLFVIIFVTLCYSYSRKHLLSSLLLVFLAGYFGFQVSACQLSAESGAERASKRRTNCGKDRNGKRRNRSIRARKQEHESSQLEQFCCAFQKRHTYFKVSTSSPCLSLSRIFDWVIEIFWRLCPKSG